MTDKGVDKKVVDLTNRRFGADEDKGAFGASINRSAGSGMPANEQALSLIERIIVDESLPFYVASLDGSVIHLNDHYELLDTRLGDHALAPGPVGVSAGYKVPSLQPVIQDVMASNTSVRAEEIVNLGGRDCIFLGRHIPVRNEKGDIIAVAGTYEDVTAQVRGIEEASRTQARFQDFARASSDWFFETTDELKIKTLSDRFTAIVGQPAPLFIGSELTQFGKFEENLQGRMEGPAAIRAMKPFREQLFIMQGGDGSDMRFHISAVPVFERKSGEFKGYRGVGMDVTERYEQARLAEENRVNLENLLKELTKKNMALDIATEQATTALKAKNEFLAAMSHELRTPLNAIIGFSDSFAEQAFGELTDEYLNYAKDIGNSGRHLLGLINDILDVAVIESGGLTLKLDELSVDGVIEKSVNMNLDAAKKKGLNTKALKVETGVYAKADDRRFTQIMVNLLSNAVKFTKEGGEIGIDTKVSDADNTISISVWDTGIGISGEDCEHIFEKFHQVTDHIYTRTQEGTGLGLHISRELARMMGGDVEVSSVVGEGSRFTVTLPMSSMSDDNDFDFI